MEGPDRRPALEIDEQNHAVPVDARSTQGLRVANYVRQISYDAGLRTSYVEQDFGMGLSGIAVRMPNLKTALPVQ